MSDEGHELADVVRARRAELRLSYERLGDRCVDDRTGTRVSGSWLHRLETGLPVIPPQLPQLRALASGLDLPLSRLQDAAGRQFLGLESVHPSADVRILMRHAEELTPEDLAELVEIAEIIGRRRRRETNSNE